MVSVAAKPAGVVVVIGFRRCEAVIPWCENCSAFRKAGSLDEGGKCPECGHEIANKAKAPWHFKVLVVGTGIYLLYRIGQGIDWLVHHIH